MYDFEFDQKQILSNLKKNGNDFDAAQELWLDPDSVEMQTKSEHEPRFLVVAGMTKNNSPL